MKFKLMDAAQYRALDDDAFEKRKAELIDALNDPECEVSTDDLLSEKGIVDKELERRAAVASLRNAKAAAVASGAGTVIARSNENNSGKGTFEVVRSEDPFDTEEYNRAFFDYVTRGAKTPGVIQPGWKLPMSRDNQFTTVASDVPEYVPTTMMNTIIEKADDYGELYAMFTKTNLKGGVEYPVGDFNPVASWVTESTTSESQKLADSDPIMFSYYTLQCILAQSILSSVTTIEAFQRRFPQLTLGAVIKKIEEGYFNGTGSGQMTGILTDTRIPAENKLSLTAENISSWDGWVKNVKAKMKRQYRDGIFIMNQATFDTYIDGMVDSNGQPIARVNYGITGSGMDEYRFMGKRVMTVDDDLLPSFDDASASEAFAVFTRPQEYTINSNLAMRYTRWVDEDNNVIKDKVMTILDGKILRPWGTLILTKNAGA